MNRLDRVMSNLGYCSRKEVGKLIRQGRLTV
ncbi:MAG: 16S rRNA pseudouridine(516) synthase, partial [Candidatus Eremiobacteraeota bacterium]|nr:16S rRNA pseudouridine(516) synthase [Candidatus Eremiobacteraeota bacterium]